MKRSTNALKETMGRKPTRSISRSASRNRRVLIELPSHLLDRAERAARDLQTNRSELIRNAVEQFLNDMEAKEFERLLAAAYAANADINRALAAEFEAAGPEGI